MKKIAIVFPGQGSQYIGMGLDFYNNYEVAKNIYDKADSYFGTSLKEIIFSGSEEDLKLTKNTQAAIFTTSYAIWNVLQSELSLKPSFMAGHSLGEYSALVASETVEFEDAFKLIRMRGQFMDEAVPQGQCGMAAIIGMGHEELHSICTKVSQEGNFVQLANINTQSQIVISGSNQGVEIAGQLAKENGARRVVPLAVSGPFHSSLMNPAKEKLKPIVDETKFNLTNVQVVMNVTAQPVANTDQMKENLVNQVISPVQWVNSIEWMIEEGVDIFIECGPGKVLAGLIKKINKEVKTYSIENIESLEAFKKEYRG